MNKFLIIGIIFVLLIGITSVYASSESPWHYKAWKHHKFFSKNFGDKSSFIDNLGLDEDATKDEIKAAFKQKHGTFKTDKIQAKKDKLGLDEDATDEEIKEAWIAWKEENKGLFSHKGFSHKGFGYNNGYCNKGS